MEFHKIQYLVLLFTLYIAPIQDIISAHNLDCMFYADDSQLYITIDPLDQRPVLNTRQKCISEVIEWNTISELVCNILVKQRSFSLVLLLSRTQFLVIFPLAMLEYN